MQLLLGISILRSELGNGFSFDRLREIPSIEKYLYAPKIIYTHLVLFFMLWV